jgi:hypothetical protein
VRRSGSSFNPSWGPTAFVAALAATVASIGVIGGDLPWLVPLGAVVASGHVPDSVPAAAAPTAGWHDALAGAQLLLWTVYHHLGGRGLVGLQALAAAVGFGATAVGVRRQSTAGSALLVCVVVLVGSASAVLVARLSLFSLALFPLLVLLVQEDARAPSRRVWLAVPLLALWANLHGMVLAGLALLGVYLVVVRARREPLLVVSLLGASLLAVFATPELWHTPLYYRDVFENLAAVRAVGLWAPLGLGPFDVLYVLAAVVLFALSRGRLQAWEWVVCVSLALDSVRTARVGLLLLLVLAYPAGRALRLRTPNPVVLASAGCCFAALAVGLVVASRPTSDNALARRAAATHEVVLADPLLGEWVALYGGRIWVGNPIDAFSKRDQRLYLDWTAGDVSGRPAVDHARLVLVLPTSAAGKAAARDPRLERLASSRNAVLYRVRTL